MTDITKHPIFTDEDAARAHLEDPRWPRSVMCLHCGAFGVGISLVQKSDRLCKPETDGKRQSQPVAPA